MLLIFAHLKKKTQIHLELEGIEVVHLPFFRLATKFGDLPKDKEYYLYCAKGVMSQLQALILHEEGYSNVKVYRP